MTFHEFSESMNKSPQIFFWIFFKQVIVTKYLSEHQNVDAMWYFGSPEGSKFVEHTSAVNVKRTWVNYGHPRDWMAKEQGQSEEFLYQSVQVKNVWLTMGDIFAN